MTDKEKIIAYIDKLLEKYPKNYYLLMVAEFIDTLEMKEVDLEKEIDKFYGMYRKDGKTFSLEDNEECVDWKVDCNPKFEKSFAKHFFELGLAQKGK